MFKHKKIYVIPIIGFFMMILIISFLLKSELTNNNQITYIDALYESTSMITATGSTVINISEQFNTLGEFIVLIAMEIGAIGFMSFFSIMFMISKKKLKLSDTIFLSNEVNSNNYKTLKEKAKKITRYTIIIEFFGAWLLAFRFVPMYGIKLGLWYSIFHSVSAFCNVGAGLFGNNSLTQFNNDTYVNMVFIVLMFLGSLGYFVTEDLVAYFCTAKKNKIHTETKLILVVSIFIIILGTVLIKLFDPGFTVLNSLFYTVTARNSGFYTIDLSNVSEINKFLLMIIMFIGGGPGSNAGGIRVVVFAVLILTTISNLKNDDNVVIFYKTISDKMVKKAITILSIDILIVLVGCFMLYITDPNGVLELMFFVISLFSNTGLDIIDMNALSFAGKIICIFVMYIGRIAPITLVSLFVPTESKSRGIKYPNMDIVL